MEGFGGGFGFGPGYLKIADQVGNDGMSHKIADQVGHDGMSHKIADQVGNDGKRWTHLQTSVSEQ